MKHDRRGKRVVLRIGLLMACVSAVLLMLGHAMAESSALVYSADFAAGTDGWYSVPDGVENLKRLRDKSLRMDARQSDGDALRRDFELTPGHCYAFSVEVRHFRSGYADFSVSLGSEEGAPLARLAVPAQGWTALSGTFIAGDEGKTTLSIQTVGAPDLSFDIRNFRLTALSGRSDRRPEYHFTPAVGWINDPNGLVWDDGVWHLFAQHYPYDTAWGPMHWLHATSTDLIHWKEQGIAIYPDDAHGMAFSGSAVIDADGTAGFGKNAMILIYTGHGEWEQQMIVGSRDRVNFEHCAVDPVIANWDKPDFRDPKVIRNPALNGWTMIVAAGDHDDFYHSNDLLHWRKTGEFRAAADTSGAVYECPDLFPLTAPDGDTVWVLVNSLTFPAEMGGNRTVYFLGDFDGNVFHETRPSKSLTYIDTGFDDYAGVTFANADRPIMVGWGVSWAYGPDIPTSGYRGNMTCARELSLIDTNAGLRLAAKPIVPKYTLERVPSQSLSVGDMSAKGVLTEEVFHIRVEAMPGFTLTLDNEVGETLIISVDKNDRFTIDRSHAGEADFNALYASELFSIMRAPRLLSGTVTLDLYFDHIIAEIFLDDGAMVNTSLVFPTVPYRTATLNGIGQLWIGNSIE